MHSPLSHLQKIKYNLGRNDRGPHHINTVWHKEKLAQYGVSIADDCSNVDELIRYLTEDVPPPPYEPPVPAPSSIPSQAIINIDASALRATFAHIPEATLIRIH